MGHFLYFYSTYVFQQDSAPSINYLHLQIRKIRALCGIFSAISVLLMTGNSDDLEIRVPDKSTSLKVTPVNSSRLISY